MPCTRWPAIRSATAIAFATGLAVATGGALIGPGQAGADPKRVQIIDDAVTGKALVGRFDFVGKWQLVRSKHDGRTSGTSTRSTHTGDVAILGFNGTRVRLYGVVGPSGGRAGVSLDETSTGGHPVEFFAPQVKPHALIYQSPVLRPGFHTVTLAVWGTRDAHGHYYYVNIDGAEVDN